MTREEFLAHEIYRWGEEYIFDLLERGYSLKLTNAGWRWFYTEPAQVALDNSRDSCYAGAVGAAG